MTPCAPTLCSLVLCVLGANALHRSNAVSNTLETMPIIKLSLAPPVHPLPKTSHDIHGAEKARESFEEASFVKLNTVFNSALENAKVVVGSVVDESMRMIKDADSLKILRAERGNRPAGDSLLSDAKRWLASANSPERGSAPALLAADDKFSVEVRLSPASSPDLDLKEQIRSIEKQRSDFESHLFEQAMTDLHDLTAVVADELQEQIRERIQYNSGSASGAASVDVPTSFLHELSRAETQEAAPQQANVRVLHTDGLYPTSATLLQDMQTRRDSSEDLVRARILELEMKFLMAINDIAVEAMDTAARRGMLVDRKKSATL